MAQRGDLAQGHGVRFEEVIVRQIRALADASGVTYSEMARTLVDEAILSRLARPGLDRGTLREAVLHAIEYRGYPHGISQEQDTDRGAQPMEDTPGGV